MPSYSGRSPENLAATRLLKARVAAGFTAGSVLAKDGPAERRARREAGLSVPALRPMGINEGDYPV